MCAELLDVYDDNMKKIGVMDRDEVHRTGAWHCTFHCWIIRRTEEGEYVLFQKRGPKKKMYPNLLDITAAGHLASGEIPEDGIREIAEELGIPISFDQLTPLGVRLEVAALPNIQVINREFCYTYLLESRLPLEKYLLQEQEVAGLVQMLISDGLSLFSGDVERVPVTGFMLDQGNKRSVQVQVSKDDIIPRLDRYYVKVFIMSERFFSGCQAVGI